MPIRLDWIASFRRLRRKPLYAFTVALALGIGIAAATIVFSWFEGLFLRPIPGVSGSYQLQVFELRRADFKTTAFSYPDYRDMAQALDASMEVAAFSMSRVTLSGAGKPQQYWALFVSDNFFSTLKLKPAAGRLLDSSNTAAEPSVVLSHDWWQARFQADPAIVGKTIDVNQHPVRVAGVAPPEFQGPYTGLTLGLYLPVSLQDWVETGPARLENRRAGTLTLVARLKEGVSPQQALQAARVVARRLDSTYPKGTFDQAQVSLIPYWRCPVGAQAIMGPVMLALAGVVAVVLLLACSNAAGIMLIENSQRRRDMSIRLALGAGRGSLIAYCLAEAALLSVLAAGVGLVITHFAADHLQDLVPDIQFPVKLSFPVDGPVLAFSIAAAALSAAFCGLWGGLEARWQSAAVVLRGEAGNASASRERSRMRGVFIGGQIALSFLLLCSSALFYRSVQRARTADLGFDPRFVSLVRVDLSGSRYTPARATAFFQTTVARVAASPGVESVALAKSVPLGLGDVERVAILPDGQPEPVRVWTNRVSPGYFDTLGIPVLVGRAFTDFDRAGSAQVAIVNQALAEQLWNTPVPIGRSFLLGNSRCQVVGVVRNTKIWSLTDDTQPYLYLPFWQSDVQSAAVHVKSKQPPATIFRLVREELERVDSTLPVVSAQALAQQVDAALFPQRIALVMLSIFSILGIYLTAIGLYGVIAHATQSRRKEIAIRIAMGATNAQICRLVTRQAAGMVTVGLCIGAALTVVAGRFLSSVLVNSGEIDLVSMGGAGALIAVVAIVATWGPTLRATRMETTVALRAD